MKEISNFNLKVEANDKQERNKELFKKIEHISLAYAVKKFNEERNKDFKYKFSQAIKNYTPTKNIIISSLNYLEGFDFSEYKNKIDDFIENIFKEIDNIYDPSKENIEDILNYIISKKQEIKKYLEVEDLQEIEKKNGKQISLNIMK